MKFSDALRHSSVSVAATLRSSQSDLKPAFWSLVLLVLLASLSISEPVDAVEPALEYKVVILQGVTAGGSIKKDASGVYVDDRKTRILNELAAEGWEVIAVTGSVAADHTVYLRRKKSR